MDSPESYSKLYIVIKRVIQRHNLDSYPESNSKGYQRIQRDISLWDFVTSIIYFSTFSSWEFGKKKSSVPKKSNEEGTSFLNGHENR